MLGKDMIFMLGRARSMEAAFANADTLPAAKRHIEKLGASKIWGPMQPHQSHSRPLGPKANF
jgi:hypothetical protein